MDPIEKLIKALEEAKTELYKNMNCAPGADPNMVKEELEKDARNPALAPKQVKIKQLQSQIDAGTYKPDPKKIADKMIKEEGCTMDDMKVHKNGQWEMEKADKPNMGHSVFHMDHVNQVIKMPHGEAKKMAHKLVDESTANASNKAKIKTMINSSKSSSHLAQGMSNHILAHPSEGLKTIK